MDSLQTDNNIAAETAVLFVHGILGTPEHFRCFIETIPEGYTVRNLTLKGHCASVRDFSAASMAEWKTQVHEALSQLHDTHKRIIIAAHSMGTLLAIQEAVSRPVDALFLLNVPLKIRLTPQYLQMLLKLYRNKIAADDIKGMAAKNAYSIAPDKNIFHYMRWLPRYMELFSEIRRTAAQIERLNVPCYAYLSSKDEIVSPDSEKILEANPSVIIKRLESSGHFYYAEKDKAMLLNDFQGLVLNNM